MSKSRLPRNLREHCTGEFSEFLRRYNGRLLSSRFHVPYLSVDGDTFFRNTGNHLLRKAASHIIISDLLSTPLISIHTVLIFVALTTPCTSPNARQLF
jgi:hypothetical protein